MADTPGKSAPLTDGQGTRIARKPTGAGAEAAEGIHGAPKGRSHARNPADKTSLEDRGTEGSADQQGSEPLTESDQHRSRYGGGSRKA